MLYVSMSRRIFLQYTSEFLAEFEVLKQMALMHRSRLGDRGSGPPP